MKFSVKTDGCKDPGDPEIFPLKDGDLVSGYWEGYFRYRKTFNWRKKNVYAGIESPTCPGEGYVVDGEFASLTPVYNRTGKPVKGKPKTCSAVYCMPANVHVRRKIEFLRETIASLEKMLEEVG